MTKGNLTKRINDLQLLFDQLQNTGSRLEKEDLIRDAKESDPYMGDDLNYCFEILSGKHKLGFTFNAYNCEGVIHPDDSNTLREYLTPLYSVTGRSRDDIRNIGMAYGHWGFFIERLVNREYKLGINKSQLSITDLTPMLAKKYDPDKVYPAERLYYLTEKLDGNRCIAQYSQKDKCWNFYSRSGKVLKVFFDMEDNYKHLVFDGEIMSIEQIKNPGQQNFNSLSGIVNRMGGHKSNLVYVIFDIVMDETYAKRRELLDSLEIETNNVMRLPVIDICSGDKLNTMVDNYLDDIVSRGGEGIMINDGSCVYEHKRTNALLKVKEYYTMDMRVLDITEGTGKYIGLVGSLVCQAFNDEGHSFTCSVGSGLKDYQRIHWSNYPGQIIGQIVEVAYFSISQGSKNAGSEQYSLRFPRLKKIRRDKDETSVD